MRSTLSRIARASGSRRSRSSTSALLILRSAPAAPL
jgi:hypothetical protein